MRMGSCVGLAGRKVSQQAAARQAGPRTTGGVTETRAASDNGGVEQQRAAASQAVGLPGQWSPRHWTRRSGGRPGHADCLLGQGVAVTGSLLRQQLISQLLLRLKRSDQRGIILVD